MAKARYYKADGKKGRARELPGVLFDGVVNESALHRVVKAHLANQRQGTGAAKNRAAVRGGGRKPWRQKGTGRARQGTIRAPQWAGGGVAFPPQPHSWRQRVPKKLRGLARRSAYNARAQDDRIVIIDALDFEKPSTRQLVRYLESVEVTGRVLILTDGIRENLVLSARNEPGLHVMTFGTESVYDLLLAGTILIERSALEALEQDASEHEPAAPADVGVAESEEEVGDA
ncbi:MAG: 50S ribosomal protein L4 [Gemmatimonadota bacterium]